MRHTSQEAYNTLKSNGFLTGLQAKVYDVLFNHGPLTQGEAWAEYLPEYQRHSIAPRFAELEKMGVVTTVGERPCRYSNVKGLEWDVTDHVPESKPEWVPAKRTPKQAQDDIALLEARNRGLEETNLKLIGVIEDLRDQISSSLEKPNGSIL